LQELKYLRATAEENLKLRNEVGELEAVILRMQTMKKLHKVEMKHTDKNDVFFVFVLCACILYAPVGTCVRG
jgi:hypothetical protein